MFHRQYQSIHYDEQISITLQIIRLLTKQRCILHARRQLVYMHVGLSGLSACKQLVCTGTFAL